MPGGPRKAYADECITYPECYKGDLCGWKYLPQRWNLRQEPGEITKQRTVDREKSKGKAGERRG